VATENETGRQPIAIIEIDQPQCSLTYSESPCTAVLGTDGTSKCFNTFRSCQDTENYDPSVTLTLRFVAPRSNLPLDLGVLIPCVKDYRTSPGTIRIDDGLGKRASLNIAMQDFPYHDRLVDPYQSERVSGDAQSNGVGYDPTERGTFWTKWIRRNPFYQGYACRVREGYVGDTLGQMRVRHYILERIEGPDTDGNVKITAKDPIKLADWSRAQVPVSSNGRLDAAITSGDGSATLAPAGVGDDEYPASGLIRIGDELIDFTRSGDSLTLDNRGVRGTEADSHDEDDSVQLCYTMDDDTLSDVLDDLFQNYATIDASWIPKADWDDEVSEWLFGFNLTGEITEPTGVDEVVSTLLVQNLCFMWWDEYEQEIKLQALKPPQTASSVTDLTDDANLIQNSAVIKRMPEDRRSRVYTYYDILDPTTNRDQPQNYRKLRGAIDSDAETDNEYGEIRTKRIYAPFWDNSNTGATLALNSRTLARLRDTPEVFSFLLDAKDRTLGMADVIDVQHRNGVDLTGAVETRRYQVIERDEVEPGHRIKYKAQTYTFFGRYAFIMQNSAPYYGSATEHERDTGGFISKNDETFANGDTAYKII